MRVKNYCDRLGFLTTLTVMMAAVPTMAAEYKVTDIELAQTSHQLELKLSTTGEVDQDASFYTVRKGNTIEANLLNTNLDLPEGNSFKEENLTPGIKSVEVNQVDREHTQIVISTAADVPVEHLLEQQGNDLILSLNRVTKAQSLKRELKQFGHQAVKNIKQTYKTALGQKKTKEDQKSDLTSDKTAVKNIKQTYKSAPGQKKTKDDQKSDLASDKTKVQVEATSNDVLIPDPDIVINDNRIEDIKEQVFQAQDDSTNAPATLPRAVAPPVGDMAVSNINTMPDMVDLGSSATVPRLVMRDAPVREVLSLLARSANLNVVYAAGEAEANNDEETGPTVSLDLENQPIQEVFNSVLLISGLNANRRGNIIYVGEQLPAQARNLISRTIRLNQVTAENAALYLASQGAKGKRLTNEVEEIIDPETGRVTQRRETSPELSDLDGGSDDETGTQPLMLRGLQLSTDERLNAITLVGEPRKVEVATAFITQLDARRRQVSVNVKVVDVNLNNEDIFNSSFSFGVNDTFFSQDSGSAVLNFGDTTPPDNTQVLDSQFSPTVIPLDVPGATLEPFFDIQDAPFGDVTTGINEFTDSLTPFARPNFGTNSNPFQPGLSDIDVDDDGGVEFEYTLPSLFEFPEKFLAQLEAQVISGNAKILTDPTLMVQEGQQATVKLAQNIIESVKTEIDSESGFRTITPVIVEAGVVLTVNVERIDDNGFVSLSISPSVTSVGDTQSFDSGGGAVNLLNLLSKRELNSGLVRLRDGQTLILSGIIQDAERTAISKVPVLGDIPLLGSLFRSSDKTTERAEVIVLLTPEIVEENAGLASNFSPGKESREVLQREGVGVLGN
ncbi:MAG: secretin N-terminal domain-containing protein [Cyanobacteria bacterium P01_A01_bin.83]